MRSVGEIFRVRNWDNHLYDSKGNGITEKYGVGRGSKNVAIMVCLGEEPRDGTEPHLDLEKVMNLLGWVRKT